MKALVLLALCTTAHAEFYDGNKLLERLTSTSAYERGVGLGYVMGVHDTMQGVNHCPPKNAQAGQVRDLVENYLTNTPANRHYSGDSLVLQALKIAFPCTSGGRTL